MRHENTERENLTDKFVRGVKPADEGTRKDYWDTRCPGFGVRVTDKGHKTYFLHARWPGSRWSSRREIANATKLRSVAKAREIAWEWLAKIELDIDPHEEKRRADAERREAERVARETMFEVV